MKKKLKYILSIILIGIVFNSYLYNVKADELIDDRDLTEIQLVENPNNKNLIEKTSDSLKEIYNGIANTIQGTYYDELIAEKFVIDGMVFKKDEVATKTNELKEALKNRKEKGLNSIVVNTTKGRQYSLVDYVRYLSRTIKNKTIDKDTTWTKDKGPYYINGEIVIKKGSTLTIDKGTEVYFENTSIKANDSGIIVEGSLIINGEKDNLVTMNHINESAADGSWKGIYIDETGNAKINYATINKAGFWSDSTIYSFGSLEMSNSIIGNTDGSAITSFGDVSVINSQILNNKKNGINVYVKDKDSKIVIKENNFENNDIAVKTVYRNGYSKEFNISDNVAKYNKINGIQLYGDISGDMIFTKPGENMPYVIPGDSMKNKINQDFIINKNVNVTFNSTGIKFEDGEVENVKSKIQVNGSLNLQGTATDNMIVTSIENDAFYGDTNNDGNNSTPSIGTYQGINVAEGANLNINYANISYGGGGQAISGANIVNNGNADIKNSIISNCYTGVYSENNINLDSNNFSDISLYGLYLSPNKRSISFEAINNTFTGFKGYCAKIFIEDGGISCFNAKGNVLNNSSYAGVLLIANIEYNTKITPLISNVPYVVPNRTMVIDGKADKDYDDFKVAEGKVLNVDAGTIIKMDKNKKGYGTNMVVDGTLLLNGTSNNKVYITSIYDDSIGGHTSKSSSKIQGDKGDWDNIKISGTAGKTIFDNAVISYGGNLGAEVSVSGETLIKNTYVHNSSGKGIEILDGNVCVNNSIFEKTTASALATNTTEGKDFTLDARDNEFIDITDSAISINGRINNFNIKGENNKSLNSTRNGCELNVNILGEASIDKLGGAFPYIVNNKLELEEGSTLNIEKGIVMKNSTSGQFIVGGTLNLNGDDSNKVILTSLYDSNIAGKTIDTDIEEIKEWPGLIIKDKGVVSIKSAKDIYSTKTFNFDKISLIKAYKADVKLAQGNHGSIYVKDVIGGKDIIYYDNTDKKEEKLIKHVNGPVLSVKGNEDIVAILYENSETDRKLLIYDTATESFIAEKAIDIDLADKTFNDVLSIGNDYILCGKYQLFNKKTGEEKKISVFNEENMKQINKKFDPVVFGDKIIYKTLTDGYHSYNISDESSFGESATMVTKYTMLSGGSSSFSNTTFLAGLASDSVDRIVVFNTDDNLNMEIPLNKDSFNGSPQIYKNIISIGLKKDNDTKFTIIKPGNDENSITSDILSEGYNYSNAVAGNNSAAFIDGQLVYNITTNEGCNSNEFYNPKEAFDNELVRSYELDRGVELKFSLEKELKMISGVLDFKLGQNVSSKLLVGNNLIGFERGKEQTAGVSGEVEIGLGEVISVGGKLGASLEGKTFQKDTTYFGINASDTYKNIGKLMLGSALNDSTSILNMGPIGMLSNSVMTADVLKSDSVQQYDLSTGIGTTAGFEASASVGINPKLKDVTIGIESELAYSKNIEAVATKGLQYDKNSLQGYASVEFATIENLDCGVSLKSISKDIASEEILNNVNSDETDSDNTNNVDSNDTDNSNSDTTNSTEQQEGTKEKITLNFPSKFSYSLISKETKMVTKVYVTDSYCEIGYCDCAESDNKFIKTYYYRVEGKDYENLCNKVPYVKELRESKNGVLSVVTPCTSKGVIDKIMEEMNTADNVYYRVEGERNITEGSFSSDDILKFEDSRNKAPVSTEFSGKYTEGANLILDKGVVKNGQLVSSKCGVSFVKEDKVGLDNVVKKMAQELYNEFAPDTSTFTDGVASYSNDNNELSLSNTKGYTSASFYNIPLDFQDNVTNKNIGQGQVLLSNGVYMEIRDANDKKINSLSGTTLNMYISNKNCSIDKNNIYQYGIFYYNESTNTWQFKGGTNTIVGDKVKVSLDITKAGQYAIGKISTPTISIQDKDGNEIVNEKVMKPGDSVYFKTINNPSDNYYKGCKMIVELINDAGEVKTLKTISSSTGEISTSYSIPTSMQTANSDLSYTFRIRIVDNWGNEMIKTRNFIVAKK